MNYTSPQKERIWLEGVAAVLLAILAILCFIVQIATFSTQTTSAETALFNLLQFVLTIGFSWFASRALSRREFEASLKKFAFGAFRRVRDIETILERLQYGISNMLAVAKHAEQQNLRVVSAVVDDAKLIISSSISDWADVIGDELLALREINRLEDNKQGLSIRGEIAQGPQSQTAAELQEQIESLRARLPAALRFISNEGQGSKMGPHWLATQHFSQDGLRLQIVAGADYSDNVILAADEYPRPLLLKETSKEGLEGGPRPDFCRKGKWRNLRVLRKTPPGMGENRRTTPCPSLPRLSSLPKSVPWI